MSENITRGEGLFRPYIFLHQVAKSYVDDLEGNNMGYNPVTSMMFTCFCLEAYISHLNDHIIRCWDQAASPNMSLAKKTEAAHSKLRIPFDKSRNKPIYDLIRRRNLIVHGKTIKVTAEVEKGADVDRLDKNQDFIPLPNEDVQEAWLNGDGWLVTQDDLSTAIYEKFHPSNNEAVSTFNHVCNTIRNLDIAAIKKINGRLPDYYSGPFSHAEFILSFK